MKKLLLLTFLIPILGYSQGTEDFTNSNATTSYADGNFVGNSGLTFTYGHSRDQDTYPISGNGLMLRRASDSYITVTIPTGAGNFSFDYRKAFTSATARQLELFIDGVSVGTTPEFGTVSGEETTVYNYNYNINTSSSVIVLIKNIGSTTTNRQTIIDNIAWTANGPASCGITASGIAALTCNDAGTSTLPLDDYLTFSLNPTGTVLGTAYTVSVSSGTITPAGGNYGAASSFQLQAGSAGAGNVTVTITDDTGGSCTLDQLITDPGACSSAVPVITMTPATLTGFNHIVGTPSAEQTFTASGIGLADDITITAPTDFQISLTSGTGFTNSLVLTQTSGSVASTTIHTRANASAMGTLSGFIIGTSTGAENDTVMVSGYADDYVYYTIDEVTTTDANGVADSIDVLVELTGVVYCGDFDGNAGYSITFIDGSEEGINLFNFADLPNYTDPMEGDSLRVFGKIGQFNGLLQVVADSIQLLAQGVSLITPVTVTALNETTESQYIKMMNLTLVTPMATFAVGNSNVDVTDGVVTFVLRIDGDTDLPGSAAPQGLFNVMGVGGQFDSSSPFDSGYQLFPCGTSSFEDVCTTPANTTTLSGTSTASSTVTGIQYQWINCSDSSAIAGASNQSFTAVYSGAYAVIVIDGACSDTSACVSLIGTSAGINENVLLNSVSVYPNPVKDILTVKNTSGQAVSFVVVDMNGKEISKSTTVLSATTVSTSTWNQGVYFVKFSSINGEAILRVVK